MTALYQTANPHPGGYRDIDLARVAAAGNQVRIVDVREPGEYTGELGHAPRAELVPLAMLEQAAHSWDKGQEIVIVCRSGARSSRAAALLASMGFSRIMNMTGGMLAWSAAGLPVDR